MKNIDTMCIHEGYDPKPGEARTLPICQSTTFYYDKPEDMTDLFDLKKEGFFYSRIGNPTVDALERKMAAMDGGVGALATSSGQAANFIALFNVLRAGDSFISSSSIYGGTFNLFGVTMKKMGIECIFVDPNASYEEIRASVKPNTKAIFGETFANPAMNVLDFEKFSKVAKEFNILFVVDNTLCTPCICKCGDFGANVVTYSTTKYVEGHAQTIGGMIVDMGNFQFDEKYPDFNQPDESYHGLIYNTLGKTAYIVKARVQMMRDFGCYMDANTAHLTNAGLETLAVRMQRHSENGLKIATALKNDKRIEFVRYPFLEGDEYHDLAKKYMKDGAGVVVFGIKGDEQLAKEFIANLKLVKQVTHIADLRSCVLQPSMTTHRQLSREALLKAGIPMNLIRFSCGIENGEDILQDLLQALDAVTGK